MIQELLGGTAMDHQLKGAAGGLNHASLPMMLQPIVSNPSPMSSSSTSSRSTSAMQQRSSSATSSPQSAEAAAADQQAAAPPLRCPRCNSSNTKFCYYNNYNLTQPRHFCKTCRRYWTKGGALRNVPIGGGCRKPRPMPAPVAKPLPPPLSCKGVAPPLGLGGGQFPWAAASGQQQHHQAAATAHLMALLNSARGMQGHGGVGGGNVHRLLGLDTMGHLQILPGGPNGAGAGATASLWPQSAPRPVTPPPHMDSQLGAMGTMGHHDVLSSLGLKLPSSASSSPSPAASYYSDQLHAVVSNAGGAGRPQAAYVDASSATSLPCSTAVTSSLSSALSSVTAAPPIIGNTAGMELTPVSLGAPEMQYWNSPAAAMSMATWPDLPTPNGAFP